jgi:hypothetical protein
MRGQLRELLLHCQRLLASSNASSLQPRELRVAALLKRTVAMRLSAIEFSQHRQRFLEILERFIILAD